MSEGIIAAASEGFIVAAISATAYIFAFVYEAGFAKVFHMPLALIAISLTNVLIAAGSLLIVGHLLLSAANLVFVVFDRFKGPISSKVKLLTPLILYSLAVLLVTAGTPMLSIWMVMVLFGGCVLGIFFLFIFHMLTQRDKSSYQDKLVAQDELDAHTRDLWSLFAKRFGVGPYNLLLSLVIALLVIYMAGQSAAMRQSSYLVTSTFPEMIVLRIYGDNIICAPFDREAREVEPSFIVLRIGEDPELMLYSESVGPLSLRMQTSRVNDSSSQSPIPVP